MAIPVESVYQPGREKAVMTTVTTKADASKLASLREGEKQRKILSSCAL
jgi:hypothetical protein